MVCSRSGAEIRSEIDPLIDPSQEHVKVHNFNLFTSHRVIAQFYGEQVKQYFNFVWFVMLTNVVFTCIALIRYFPREFSLPLLRIWYLFRISLEGQGVDLV